MIWELIRALLGGIAIIWTIGSVGIAVCKPWRHLEPEDRWLTWALIAAWPIGAAAIGADIGWELWLDRRDARARRVR